MIEQYIKQAEELMKKGGQLTNEETILLDYCNFMIRNGGQWVKERP